MRAVALLRVRLLPIHLRPPSDRALELHRFNLPAAVVVHQPDELLAQLLRLAPPRLHRREPQVFANRPAQEIILLQRLGQLRAVDRPVLVHVDVCEHREPLLVEVLRGFADA
eukprot:30787-Pelagococcus_subviridis.AAC.3